MDGQTCQFCRVGRFRATKAPYIRIVQQQAITIPNAPAIRCDVCHEILFDPGFIPRIDYLLEQETNAEPRAKVNRPYYEERPLRPQSRKLRD